MIKTEQELKDALEDIFFDALTDKSNPPYYTDKVDPENDGYWQCKVYELCADELIKRGYGDVSEYKAEIERLHSNTPQPLKDLLVEFDEMGFAPTTVCPNPDKYATEWRDRLVNCVNDATKQAQTDVLNKLKTNLSKSDDFMDICSWHIDKLIKEVQNEIQTRTTRRNGKNDR